MVNFLISYKWGGLNRERELISNFDTGGRGFLEKGLNRGELNEAFTVCFEVVRHALHPILFSPPGLNLAIIQTTATVNKSARLDFAKGLQSCSGYYQRKSFGFSPEEPDASRSALESAQYRSEGHRPSPFVLPLLTRACPKRFARLIDQRANQS